MAAQRLLDALGLNGYPPMPVTLVLPYAEWEDYVKNIRSERHGIAWVFKRGEPLGSYVRRNESH